MHRIMTHGHKLLEEKAAVILGMKDELRRTSEHYNKVTEMQTIGQREAEMKYKDKLYELQAQFEEKKRNLSEQYDHIIEQKDAEISKFVSEAQEYMKSKK